MQVVLVGVEDAELHKTVPTAEHDPAFPGERPAERADRIGHYLAGVSSRVVRKSFGRHTVDNPTFTQHNSVPQGRSSTSITPIELLNLVQSY